VPPELEVFGKQRQKKEIPGSGNRIYQILATGFDKYGPEFCFT
jgi:hypothetical protein